MRLGAFRWNAAAELGLGYDDNLFGSRRNRRSDGYSTWLAETGISSDWSRHAVGATARIEQRRYWENTALDWTDYTVGAFGRYDVNADTNVELRYNRVQEHLETDSIDVQQAGISRPVPYYYDEAQVQGATRFNRIGLTAIGNWRRYRFDDVDLGGTVPAGTPNPGELSRFDFNSLLGALGLSYEFAPGRFANLIGRFQDIRYDNSSQSGRDSKTYEALGGLTYDFDGIWQARFALGYRQRDYEQPGLKSLSGPAFEGEVTYQPTLLTTFSLSARRTIEESIRNNAVSFTRTQAQFNVDHEYLRNVILGLELQLDRREYDQPSQQATDGVAILSARWLINRRFSVVTSYQHARRLDSSAGVQEFDRNLVQVRLRIAL
ncbi:outer membrane beta-barrel protein [Falsiroseomonas sp. CW058]|uniref:outer membrane beta-barrel protein n=1 Tax=Falsiroseomonas sp. CW058 TaxID=3388664 RepID=UPI003D322639